MHRRFLPGIAGILLVFFSACTAPPAQTPHGGAGSSSSSGNMVNASPSLSAASSSGRPQVVYEHHSDALYRNATWGFTFQVPASWKDYAVRAEADTVTFALPLKTRAFMDAGLTKMPFYDVWSITVLPVAEWEKRRDECKNAEYPCFYPTELARDTRNVYGGNPFAIAGGYVPCPQFEKQEPYLCRVMTDISAMDHDGKYYPWNGHFHLIGNR